MLTSHDYEELILLGVLEEIDPRNQHLIAENPDVSAEFSELNDTFHGFAYNCPLLPLADSLKERLLQRITAPTPIVSLKQDQQQWQPHPNVSGIMMAILRINAEKREIVTLLKCVAGAVYPLHRHAGEEEILVLEGDLESNDAVYSQGDYLYSPLNSLHSLRTQTGCLLYVRTHLDNEYISVA